MQIRQRIVLLTGLLGIVGVGSLGLTLHQSNASTADDEAARLEVQATLERIRAQKEERGRQQIKMPYPDEVLGGWSLPESAWIHGEKRRYAMALASYRADVLIAPTQTQGYGIERANRSLMTASLAEALPRHLQVAPPELVARALGDGHRRIQRAEVLELADQIGAVKVIWPYAGHRSDQKLHLHFEVLERDEKGRFDKDAVPQGIAIELQPMPDEAAPIDVFRAQLPRLVEMLGYAWTPPDTLSSAMLPEHFPKSLGDMASRRHPVAHQALYLQLLAALAPKDAGRARERLYERSLMLAWRLPKELQSSRLLVARGYFGLGMRTAALSALGQPTGSAEQAMASALNGNITDIDRWRSDLGTTPIGLMAAIDAAEMRYAYELTSHAKKADDMTLVAALPAPWKQLAAGRMRDASSGASRPGNLEIFLELLGKEFSNAGPGFAERLRGRAIVGQLDRNAAENALAGYLDPMVAIPVAHRDGKSTTRLGPLPNQFYVHDFLVESGISEVIHRARRTIQVQGLYEDGLNYLASIEPIFNGHPALMRLQAYAEDKLAQLADPATHEARQNRVSEMDWRATDLLKATDRQPTDRPSLVTADDPERFVGSRVAADWLAASQAAMVNATHSTAALKAVFTLTDSPDERSRLLESTAGRFEGSSVPVLLRADLLFDQGKVGEGMTVLAEAARKRLPAWDIYKSLATHFLREQRYEESANAFAAFPGFERGATLSALEIDNRAYQAGSYLYWRGAPDQGASLFRIIEGSNTGSAASLLGKAHTALLDRDYATALRGYFLAVRRYNDPTAYRSYFGLLHLLGESNAAWDALRVQAPRLRDIRLWDGSLAGHRRAGLSHAQIIEWSKQSGMLTAMQPDPVVFRYLVQTAVTDRIPATADIHALEQLSAESTPSVLQLSFARAYRAIRRGDFGEAESLLSEAMKRQPMSGPDVTYVLPYYVLAAVKAGKADAAESTISRFAAENRMDYVLARAVVDGLAEKPGSAKGFREALIEQEYTLGRPLTVEYQLCDLADQLLQLTGNPEYREFALRLARANQKTQPWESWSHALVAVLSESEPERRAALTQAVYLDPGSAWLERIPPKERAAAKSAAQARSPFVIQKATKKSA